MSPSPSPYSGQESFVERMKLVADTVNREYRLGKLTLPPLYNTVCNNIDMMT